MARPGPGSGLVAATSSFRPEWRNLLAEWGWWLGAPNGAVRAGAGIGIEDRGAVETAFCKWKILNGEV